MAEEQLIATIRAELSQFRQGMEEAARVAATTGQRIRKESDEASQGFASMERAIGAAKSALGAFGVTVGLGALVKLGKDAVDAALKMQSVELGFKAITGSAGAAQNAMEFVRKTANDLGQELTSVASGFLKFSASTRQTTIEGEATRRIFTQVAGASRALGLSVDETNGIFLAITQSMSKGTIQSEELRGQIGERLPGAFQIAARAMGVSTEALGKMLEKGQEAGDFFVKFGNQLEKELGGGAEAATKSAAASFTRLVNEIKELSIALGQSIIGGLQPAVDFAVQTLARFRKDREDLKAAQVAATGPVPAALPANVPSPGLNTAMEFVRTQTLNEQQAIEGMVQALRAPGLDAASRAAIEANMADARKNVESLTRSLADLVIQGQKASQVLGEPAKGATAFYKVDVAPLGAEFKSIIGLVEVLDTGLKQIAIDTKLFGASGNEAGLAAAKRGLQLIEKQATELVQILAKVPENQQDSRFQAVIKDIQARVTAQRGVVEGLEATIKAEKDATSASESAAKKQVADIKTIAEARESLLDKVVQGKNFTLRDPGVEQITNDITYFNQLLTTETGPRLEAVKSILFELENAKAKAFGTFPPDFSMGLEIAADRAEVLKKQLEENDRVTKDFLAAQARLREIGAREESVFAERRLKLDREIQDLEERMGGETDDSIRARAAGRAKIQEDETRHVATELKKQNAEYERFAQQATRTLSNSLFDVISGRIDSLKDLFGSLKDYFLRVLTDMVAAAVVSGLFSPGTGWGTTGGAGGTAGTQAGSGGTNVVGAIQSGVGYLKNAYSLYTTLFGSGATAAQVAAGQATLGATAAPALYATTEAVGATAIGAGSSAGAAAAPGAAAAGGTLLGTAVTGAGYGIAAGLIASKLLSYAGLHGTANTTLAGAAGGAVAGTVILPGIGTAIGAVLGAIGGYLAGVLGKKPAPPGFTAPAAEGTVPQFALDASGRIESSGPGFRPPVGGRQLNAQGLRTIQDALHDVTGEVIKPVVETLRQFPKAFQSMALNQLNSLGEALRVHVGTIKFSGDDWVEEFKTFLEKDLPEKVKTTFDPFLKLLEKLGPIFQTAQQLMQQLQQQEQAALSRIAGVRASINDAGLSQLAVFKQNRILLDQLVNAYTVALPEPQRLILGEQIAGLIQTLGQQGTALFRGAGDDAGLAVFKQSLNQALTVIETDTRNIFAINQNAVQQQIDLLAGIFNTSQSVDELTAQVVARLEEIAGLLKPVGSFQTEIGEVRQIPQTGLALVHQGELIGRPLASASAPLRTQGTLLSSATPGTPTITVHVDARGATDPQAIGRTTASAIRKTLRELQQAARYRQSGGL